MAKNGFVLRRMGAWRTSVAATIYKVALSHFAEAFQSAYASRRFLGSAALEAVAWRESKRFGGAPAHESDAKTHRIPKALRAKAILAPPRLLWRRRLGAQEAEDDTKINRRRGKIPVPFMRWAGSTSTRPGPGYIFS